MTFTKINKIMMKYHIGTCMAVIFMFFSCSKEKTIAELSTPKVDKGLTNVINERAISDQDVFKGVIFLDGPVAMKLSDFKEFNIRSFTSDKSKIQEVIDFQNTIITKLEEGNKNYLKEFRTKIGSGDYYTVKSTIEKAADDILNISITSGEDKVSLIDNGVTLANNFKNKYNLNSNSSHQEILNAIKESNNDDPKGGPITLKQNPCVEVEVAVYVYIAAVAAAIIVALIFLAAEPGNKSLLVNDYLHENYLSQITLSLNKI